MNVISQILLAVLITSISGTMGLGVWWIVKKSSMRWNPRLMYVLLRVVCLLYLVPLGYGLVQLTVRGYIQMEGLWQMNFLITGGLWIIAVAAGVLWLVLGGRSVAAYIRTCRKVHELCRYNLPEQNEAAEEEFFCVKEELGIRRDISLFRNDNISSPMVTGVLRRSVILPTKEYSREQLRVIFYHELTHYKNHDPFFGLCTICVKVIHALNPAAKKLAQLMDEWNELYCDACVMEALGGMDTGRYFGVILNSIKSRSCEVDGDHIFSMLCESVAKLERRIDYMKKYEKMKKATKGMTAFLAFAITLFSVSTAYAAERGMAGLHDEVYKYAEVQTAENGGEPVELEEHFLSAEEDDSYDEIVYANPELEIISPALDANVPVAFNWSVASGVRMVSGSFHVDAGQTISIAAVGIPGDSTFWIGIQDQWNNIRYVQGTSNLSYGFPITSSGSYRVFVQNKSSVTLTASGSYYYY